MLYAHIIIWLLRGVSSCQYVLYFLSCFFFFFFFLQQYVVFASKSVRVANPQLVAQIAQQEHLLRVEEMQRADWLIYLVWMRDKICC